MSVIIITPPPVPSTADPALLIIYHQQLAAHCLALLDEVAATIPRLEESMPLPAGSGSGHNNISNVFLGTTLDSIEQAPALQVAGRLDPHRGRATMLLMEAFGPVRDKVLAFHRNLVQVLNAGRSSLVVEALTTYDLAKGLARDPRNTDLLACVVNMRRDLGRAREKKT